MACYTKRLKCVIQVRHACLPVSWPLPKSAFASKAFDVARTTVQDTLDMRKAQWRRKLHRDRAKALSQLRDQVSPVFPAFPKPKPLCSQTQSD